MAVAAADLSLTLLDERELPASFVSSQPIVEPIQSDPILIANQLKPGKMISQMANWQNGEWRMRCFVV